jgi:hypothetical protein
LDSFDVLPNYPRLQASVLLEHLEVFGRIGGPGRDRTGDLFHAMEARSQLRHRPTIEDKKPKPDEVGIEGTTGFIFAHIAGIVNASSILLFVSTGLFWHN